MCKNASNKLNALARLSHHMTNTQKKLIFSSFIKSQFSYCPLIWMFCSRTANNRINKIHERSLRVIYDDYNISFDELLQLNCETTIHLKNVQNLMIEVYKFLHGLSPPIMNEVFYIRHNIDNLRNFRPLETGPVRTNFGSESINYKAAQIWNLVPDEMRNLQSFLSFKHAIKSWSCDNCPCRLCKQFIPSLGFI